MNSSIKNKTFFLIKAQFFICFCQIIFFGQTRTVLETRHHQKHKYRGLLSYPSASSDPRQEKPDNPQTTKSRSVPYHFKDIFKPLLINYKVSTLLRKVAQPNDFKTRDMKLVDDN